MMRVFDAIIFDLGGVILNIDYEATEAALRDLLGPHSKDYYLSTQQSGVFDAFEKGQISPEEFRAKLSTRAAKSFASSALDKAWNAMLGELPLARMAFIGQLAKRYRVFLLSNTNLIHYEAFQKIATETLNGASFNQFFEKAYFSHEIGMRKPDREIFEFVLTEQQLRPDRTLFIDDLIANVEGAKQTGLEVFHLHGELLTAPLQFLLE